MSRISCFTAPCNKPPLVPFQAPSCQNPDGQNIIRKIHLNTEADPKESTGMSNPAVVNDPLEQVEKEWEEKQLAP